MCPFVKLFLTVSLPRTFWWILFSAAKALFLLTIWRTVKYQIFFSIGWFRDDWYHYNISKHCMSFHLFFLNPSEEFYNFLTYSMSLFLDIAVIDYRAFPSYFLSGCFGHERVLYIFIYSQLLNNTTVGVPTLRTVENSNVISLPCLRFLCILCSYPSEDPQLWLM